MKRQEVLLSIQRALLGCVSSSLRAVTVSWGNDNLHIIFFYDGEISNIDRDLAKEAIGQILIDFEGVTNNMEIVRLDAPGRIPCLEAFAYYRCEN